MGVTRQQLSCPVLARRVKLPLVSGSKTPGSTDVYRREARRLRGRYAGQPGKLYNSLRRLSDAHDRNYPGSRGAFNGIPFSSDGFAQLVAGELEAGVLRYSARSRLLSVAQSLGMGRFQANLVIAAVQHQKGRSDDVSPRCFSLPWLGAVLAIILLQVILIAAFWFAFHLP